LKRGKGELLFYSIEEYSMNRREVSLLFLMKKGVVDKNRWEVG